mgnify:CR=1 FL=1
MFAVGNNLNRAHNYFQDFWKRFSILFKAQQLQLIRKTETNKKREREREREAHPGLTCAGPATWLGPAYWLCQSSSSSRQKDAERVAGARGHTPATSCFRRRLETPRGATRPPRPPLILAHSPLVSLTLSRTMADELVAVSPP